MGGLPICRRCQRAIKKPSDNDAEEERMHINCADKKREEDSIKGSLMPYFHTLEEEYAYNRDKTMQWLFLCEAW